METPCEPAWSKRLPNRAGLGLLTFAWMLASAACTTTQISTPAATGAALPAEPPPSAYVRMLRDQGVTVDIPSRGKFILVNIPSYELVALEDGNPVLRSRVVVGKPATSTPELLSSIYAVRFNPAWMPTPSMIRNEGLRYTPPGPQNPLGRLMFAMDNDEFIYLHDTNEPYLFGRAQRALSHGCVRVEQVRALAAWVLGVSEEEVGAMIAKGTYSVPLEEGVPVSLSYFTRFPDEHGQAATYPDVYASQRTAALESIN